MSALKNTPPEVRFSVVSLVGEDKRRQTALEIKCHKCPRTSFIRTSGRLFMPTEKSAAKFEQMGWIVANAKNGDRDVCPDCRNKAPPLAIVPTAPAPIEPVIAKQPEPEPEKVIQLMPQQSPLTVVSDPAPPSIAQRRTILDKLEECYDEPKKAYKASWSDAKVAEALNFPRKWIETIRAEFFGPDENLATKARLADLEALLPQIKAVEDKHLALASEAEQLRKTVLKALGQGSL